MSNSDPPNNFIETFDIRYFESKFMKLKVEIVPFVLQALSSTVTKWLKVWLKTPYD